MRSVTFLLQEIPHYRVAFFDKLDVSFAASDIRLQVLYGRGGPRSSSVDGLVHRPYATAVPTFVGKYFNMDIVWQPCFLRVRSSDLVIVEQSNRFVMNYMLQMRRLWSQNRFAYWGHGRNLQALNRNALRERWKRKWICAADWWFAYTDLTADYVRARGFDAKRITVVNNTIDDSELTTALAQCAQQDRTLIRRELDCGEGVIAVFCGALVKSKRIDFLLSAACKVRRQVPNFELIVVGDGPERRRVEQASSENKWIHCVGKAYGSECAKYWFAADFALMPAPVGLVAVDSLVSQCPMITIDDQSHGPEIAYLHHGENALITSNSLDAYVDSIVALARDPALLNRLRAGCRSDSPRYSLDAMVENFAHGVRACLERSQHASWRASPRLNGRENLGCANE